MMPLASRNFCSFAGNSQGMKWIVDPPVWLKPKFHFA
jgi:hypothetical protein